MWNEVVKEGTQAVRYSRVITPKGTKCMKMVDKVKYVVAFASDTGKRRVRAGPRTGYWSGGSWRKMKAVRNSSRLRALREEGHTNPVKC